MKIYDNRHRAEVCRNFLSSGATGDFLPARAVKLVAGGMVCQVSRRDSKV